MYEIDSARERVDMDVVWRFLSTEAYWRRERTRADVEDGVATASHLVGAYDADGAMIGFAKARAEDDGWVWLDDVFVLAGHRGRATASSASTRSLWSGL